MAISASQVKQRISELLEINKKDADNILWAFGEFCTEVVEQGETVTLPGLGKLSCKVQPARNARNPRTGEAVKVPAKVAIKFSIAKSLKDSAPTLKSKQGKALLADAEAKQLEREKKKKKRERAAKEGKVAKVGRPKGSGKKKSVEKKKKSKASSKPKNRF